MDVPWYCRCCYSADVLESLCGTELDVYSLICNTKGTKDGHTQIVACLRCREFLKNIQHFKTEGRGVDDSIDDKLDVKFHKGQLISSNMNNDNLSQVEIKTEIMVECDKLNSETSHQMFKSSLRNLLVSNIMDGSSRFQDPDDIADENLLVALHDIKTHPSLEHGQEMMTKITTKKRERKRLFKPCQKVNSNETIPDYQMPFLCKICNRRYTSRKSLNSHMRTHLDDKDMPQKCNECSYATFDKSRLKNHIVTKHSNEKPYACDTCSYRYKTKYSLSRHIMAHLDVNDKPHKCSQCSFTTIYKRNLKEHIASKHNDEKPYACDTCGYRCNVKYTLSRHIMAHLDVNEKPHKCSECSFTTTNKRNLKEHITSKHSDEKPYACDTCGYRCKLKNRLSRHFRTHVNEIPHKCKECSYSTKHESRLKKHIAIVHSNEKPYSCDTCGYRCRLEYIFSRHMMTHLNSNDKPHKCSECSYTTILYRRLKEHIAANHSDEKPFTCDMCGYRCKLKYTLYRHIMAHLNISESPHKCSECSFTAINKRLLKTHIASEHSVVKPFSCGINNIEIKKEQL